MSQRIVPFIGYEDAAGAIEWLERAFGFREDSGQRHEENGTITHAELQLDGATIYLATPAGYASPRTLRSESRERAAGIRQPVGDRRALRRDRRSSTRTTSRHERRARRSSASPAIPGIGHRTYTAEDPEGHRWMFGQRVG